MTGTVKIVLASVLTEGASVGPGSTSILSRWHHGEVEERPSSTIGIEYETVAYGEPPVTLYVWDTGSNPRWQAINRSVFPGTQCVCLVIDLSAPCGFEALSLYNTFPDDVKEHRRVVVIGNKCDVDARALMDNMAAVRAQERAGVRADERPHRRGCTRGAGRRRACRACRDGAKWRPRSGGR